jgi:uncharacterized protein YjbI with pentapeptide repeats
MVRTHTDRCSFSIHDVETILRRRGFDDIGIGQFLEQFHSNWRCWRKRYGKSTKCIFHSEEKDPAQFMVEFRKDLNKMKANRDTLDFTGFIFPSTMDFEDKAHGPLAFKKFASFVGAKFREVGFRGVTFQEAWFHGATFQGRADFFRAAFEGRAVFLGVEFQEVSFENVVFNKLTVFTGSTFKAFANFGEAMFLSRVWFKEATFQQVWFDRAVFAEARFNSATFSDEAYFDNAAFVGNVEFEDVNLARPKTVAFVGRPWGEPHLDEFYDSMDEIIRPRVQRFWGKDLSKLQEVFARGRMSLSTVEFLGTEVGRIQFVNVEWGERRLGIRYLGLKRRAVRDELELYEYERNPDYGAVAALYRDLRHCYEEGLRYSEAGDFYVGEMEMRRLDTSRRSKPRIRESDSFPRRLLMRLIQTFFVTWDWMRCNFLSPISWYRNLSLYGESYKLAGLWAMASVVTFALLRTIFLQPTQAVWDLFGLDKALSRSFFAFFQLRSDDVMDDIERIVGAFMLGMLLISLRRKFERRP